MPETRAAVRSATEGDLAAIVPLLQAQLREHGIPARLERLTEQVGALLAQPSLGFVVVAEAEGAPVGAADQARAVNLYGRSGFRSMDRTRYTRPLARRDSETAAVETDDVNPTGRFSDRADDYVKYRPSYPVLRHGRNRSRLSRRAAP